MYAIMHFIHIIINQNDFECNKKKYFQNYDSVIGSSLCGIFLNYIHKNIKY